MCFIPFVLISEVLTFTICFISFWFFNNCIFSSHVIGNTSHVSVQGPFVVHSRRPNNSEKINEKHHSCAHNWSNSTYKKKVHRKVYTQNKVLFYKVSFKVSCLLFINSYNNLHISIVFLIHIIILVVVRVLFPSVFYLQSC